VRPTLHSSSYNAPQIPGLTESPGKETGEKNKVGKVGKERRDGG